MGMNEMTIGRVAGAAGVNVETIRFYQRLGLVAQPAKPSGGVRRYPEDTVLRVSFIKRAQQLGFSLAEIGHLLELEKARSCAKTHDLAVMKLMAVEARIADLDRIRRMLRTLVAQCETGKGRIACPIIDSLSAPPSGRKARQAAA